MACTDILKESAFSLYLVSVNFDNSQSKNGIMWEGRSLGVYSYINTKYIQVGLSVLLILLTGSRSPTLGIRLNGGLTFLFLCLSFLILNRIAGP